MALGVALGEGWFTEVCEECGSAFSVRVRAKLHDETTPFQHVEVYQTEALGKLLAIDGYLMLTERDHFIYHEVLTHPALFTHPAPGRVVIIGGGDCGALREVLEHPEVGEAVQIEIDERVTRIAERYFPQLCEANDDARARMVFADGIAWMREAPDGAADVVIVDSTDPVGPAAGLFTEDFYRECRRVLGAGGVLVQQSGSPLVHLDILRPMHEAMRAADFEHTQALNFHQGTYPTGWWTATLASAATPLTEFRAQAAAERPFDTRYYSAAVHRASMAAPMFLREALAEGA